LETIALNGAMTIERSAELEALQDATAGERG
jgi:hypothetical protein